MAKRTFAFVAVFAALLSVTLSVQAEDLDYYWVGSSNTNIFTAGNWKVGSPDGPTATVSLTTSGYNFDLYVNSTSQTIQFDNSDFASIRTLNIGTLAGTTTAAVQRTGGYTFIIGNGKTLNVYTGGSFTYNHTQEFQTNGTINVSGGSFTIQRATNFRLGNANSTTLTISSGELTVNSPAYIGVSPYTGTINQTGGNATFTSDLDLGWGNGAVGQYNLTGGTLTTTGPAGLWTGNPTGVSTFTVNGGTANFTKSDESFTVGLGGTNQLENVFTLTSGTVNVADTFAVKYKGILNVNGGEFNAPKITVDGTSTLNMTGGTLKTRAIDMNGGTFTQGGGTLVYDGTLAVTGSAVLNGTIDMSRLVANPSQQVTVVTTTNGVSGSYNVTGSGWTPSSDGNKITATFTGDTNAAYWNNGSDGTINYDTGSNWIEYNKDGQWKTVTTTYIFGNSNTQSDRICYILPYYDAETSTVKNVNINFNNTYTQVQSLTIGNGIGGTTGTVTATRTGQLDVTKLLIINKGGKFTDNGQFSVSSGGTLNINGGEFIANSGSNQVTNNGTITVSNEGSLSITSTSSFRIGDRGVGVLNIDGGNLTVNSLTYLGVGTSFEAQSSGTINQTAGNATFNNVLYLGWGDWSGTYNLSGGTLTTTNETGLWSGNSSGVSKFNMTGGTANFQKTGESFTVGLGGSQTLANAFNLYSGTVNATDTFAVKNSGALNVAKNGEDGGDGVLNANKIDIANNGELNLSSGTINLGAGGITNSGGSYNINLSGGTLGNYNDSWTSALTANIASGTAVTFAPASGKTITWSGALTGSGGVTVDGADTLTLSGNNTYSGGTTITAGTLKLADGGTLGSGNVTNNANLEIATDAGRDFSTVISGTGSLTKTGTGVLRYSGAGTYSGGTNISGGAIRLDPNGSLGSGTINIAAGADLRFAGNLNGITISNTITGAGGLTKQGTGNTVTLSGDLSGFTGTLTTNGENGQTDSTIKLTGANTNLVNASAVVDNGTLDVSGYTGTTTMQLNKLSGAGNVKTGSNAIILNNAANADTTFSGVINGSGSVTKTGAGTLELTGANDYSGVTTISTGTLKLSGSGALGTGSIVDNATLEFAHTGTQSFSNVISGTGAVTKTGSGTVTLSGANTYSGGTTISAGALVLSENGTLGAGDVENNAVLEFAHSSNMDFSNVISGTGAVNKTGTGTLTLSGANTYTGMTTVSAGVLELTGDAVVANGPVSVGANGTLEYEVGKDGNNQPITKKLSISEINKIVSTGTVKKTGDGTLQLYSAAQGLIDVESLTVSSGRVDLKGYMTGGITVDADGVFSPGNSVGEATFGGGYILKEGATLLIEQDGSGIDKLNVGSFTFDETSVSKGIELDITGIPFGSQYDIITSSTDFTGDMLSDEYWLKHFKNDLPDYMTLVVVNNNTVRLSIDRNQVPEPSTWALLVLGAAGLLYWRKKKNA